MCSTYGGSTPGYTVYTVGTGTAYPNSSNLPSSSLLAVKLLVVGDFTINFSLSLSNSIVKINPNVKIIVQTFNSLTINNTKMFACSELWKGVEMTSFSVFNMTNNSQIEDAENAVKAINTSFVYVAIDNSIFNRNKIGINFEDSGSNFFSPRFDYFVNNNFTCTSPLNGTSSDYTDIGVRLKNISQPLTFNYGNSHNEFKDLDNGMVIQGEGTDMRIDWYRFISIKNKCIEFSDGDNLNIQNSVFQDIKFWGVHFLNSRQLIAENNWLGANLDNSITFRRYMIDVETPKIDNNIRINHNSWLNYADFIHCLSIRPSFQPVFLNAVVTDNNTFQLFNASGTIATAIYLGGNYTTASSVEVFNNFFNFDGNNSTAINFGIAVRDGNKNNVKIIANKFKAGFATYCTLAGSDGFDNEFSDNKFLQGGYNQVGLGLAINDFKNAKICSNTDNFATFKTYAFINTNYNTDFTNNITYGRVTPNNPSLTIGGVFNNPFSVMGTQFHKGNRWLSWSGTNPWLVNYSTSTADVLLSQFIVHTTQPSIYFPADIQTPNAPFSAFFTTLPGTPSDACVTQQPSAIVDPVIDPLIAQVKMSEYTTNPAQLFDADLHLLRKIKKYPSAYNGEQIYKNFIEKNQGKNKEKINNLENAIDESYTIKEATKNKILDLRNKIKLLDEGNRKYNKTNRPTNDEIKAFYKQRLELDESINALYNEHKSEKKLKNKDAKVIVDNIAPQALHEKLVKEVYQIYLDAQITNEGIFTAAQQARMKTIASTCVTEGGMIIYVARGLLSLKDLDDIQKTIEVCEPTLSAEAYQTENSNIQVQSNLKNIAKPTIFPNPANESFTIHINKDLTGTAQVIDLTGRLIKSINLISGNNTFRHGITKGIYMVNIKLSDGQSLTQKLSINY